MRVHCNLDNSECEKNIKSVSIQLKRILIFWADKKNKYTLPKTVAKVKYDGVKKGSKKEMILELELRELSNEKNNDLIKAGIKRK